MRLFGIFSYTWISKMVIPAVIFFKDIMLPEYCCPKRFFSKYMETKNETNVKLIYLKILETGEAPSLGGTRYIGFTCLDTIAA